MVKLPIPQVGKPYDAGVISAHESRRSMSSPGFNCIIFPTIPAKAFGTSAFIARGEQVGKEQSAIQEGTFLQASRLPMITQSCPQRFIVTKL